MHEFVGVYDLGGGGNETFGLGLYAPARARGPTGRGGGMTGSQWVGLVAHVSFVTLLAWWGLSALEAYVERTAPGVEGDTYPETTGPSVLITDSERGYGVPMLGTIMGDREDPVSGCRCASCRTQDC